MTLRFTYYSMDQVITRNMRLAPSFNVPTTVCFSDLMSRAMRVFADDDTIPLEYTDSKVCERCFLRRQLSSIVPRDTKPPRMAPDDGPMGCCTETTHMLKGADIIDFATSQKEDEAPVICNVVIANSEAGSGDSTKVTSVILLETEAPEYLADNPATESGDAYYDRHGDALKRIELTDMITNLDVEKNSGVLELKNVRAPWNVFLLVNGSINSLDRVHTVVGITSVSDVSALEAMFNNKQRNRYRQMHQHLGYWIVVMNTSGFTNWEHAKRYFYHWYTNTRGIFSRMVRGLVMYDKYRSCMPDLKLQSVALSKSDKLTKIHGRIQNTHGASRLAPTPHPNDQDGIPSKKRKHGSQEGENDRKKVRPAFNSDAQ